MLDIRLENFLNLENTNSVNTFNVDEISEDEIIGNIFSKIQYQRYDFIDEIIKEGWIHICWQADSGPDDPAERDVGMQASRHSEAGLDRLHSTPDPATRPNRAFFHVHGIRVIFFISR